MDKKNLIPQAAKPVVRVTQGTQINLLAELGEEVLTGTMGVTPQYEGGCFCRCSMDDDAE
jgi:bacteriocin leader peptide (microcyclamide/patellamide family)